MDQNPAGSFAQVLLQAAQVINAQNALQQKAEQEEERLRLREAYQTELAESRNKLLETREKEFEASMALKQANLQIAKINSEANTLRAQTYAAKAKASAASGPDYLKQLQVEKAKLAIEKGQGEVFDAGVKRHLGFIDNLMKNTPTSDDPVINGMGFEDIEREYRTVKHGVQAGDRNIINHVLSKKPGMNLNESSELYLGELTDRLQAMNEQKKNYLEGILSSNPNDKAAKYLLGRDFVMDVNLPKPGEDRTQVLQGAQAAANQTGALPPTAPAGTTAGDQPPSAAVKAAWDKFAGYSPEMLSTPAGLNSAASEMAQALTEAQARDATGTEMRAIGAKLKNSPALYNKVTEILRATRRK